MKYYNNDVSRMEASDFVDYNGVGWFLGVLVSLVVVLLFAMEVGRENYVRIYKKALFFSVAGDQEQLKPLLYEDKYENSRSLILSAVTDGAVVREAYQEGVLFEELFEKASLVAEIKKKRDIFNAPLRPGDKEALKLPAKLETVSSNFLKVEFLDTVAIRGILEKGNKPPEIKFVNFGVIHGLALVLIITQLGGAISFLLCCVDFGRVWYRFDWESGWLYPLFIAVIPGALPVFALRALCMFLSPSFWKRQFESRRKAKEKFAVKSLDLSSFKFEFSEAKESKIMLDKVREKLRKGSNA